MSVFAQSPVESLGRAYRANPTPVNREALRRFAGAHPKDVEGAQALLAIGAVDYERRAFDDAVAPLKAAEKRLPKLADYIAYLLVCVQSERADHTQAVKELDPLLRHEPASPVLARGVYVGARSYLELQDPKAAAELIRRYGKEAPERQSELLLGNAAEALNDPMSAVAYYQKVFYNQPATSEASQAEIALDRLKSSLGADFPPAMPQAMLNRAYRLLNAGEHARARRELDALVPQLGGDERDIAKVRIGVADFFAKENSSAYRYLKTLRVTAPEADAERLYYLHSAARRLKSDDDAADAVEQLTRKYPKSAWRMEALTSAGNSALLQGRNDVAAQYYRQCFESFPDAPGASYCHWKIAWNTYLRRSPEAAQMLRDHVAKYPASEKTPAAIYFLARLAERSNQAGVARAWYTGLNARFPNYFHAALARGRLNEPAIRDAMLSAETVEFLRSLSFASKYQGQSFEANAATKHRIDRARLLAGAGLDDWAETELKYGAKNEAQSNVLAMELAQMADRRGAPDQAIRYIKTVAAGYLNMPLDAAPAKFWRLAFPLPFRSALEEYSRARSLDPFLVAALIRQESEFNPKAVSRAKAYGLTQVLPSTGREISRKLGIRGFRAPMLFQPEVNLKLGTYYLRKLVDSLDGHWEAALASYNGGLTRVRGWLAAAAYQEPAEFIESIPITETRDYVQIVMRNADFYRRLYGAKNVPASQRIGSGVNGN